MRLLTRFNLRKQNSQYVLRTVVLESGERLPMLINRADGLPLYEPNLYALTVLRARNRASATLEQALRAITVLYQVLNILEVDLQERMSKGRVLELGEVDAILKAAQLELGELDEFADEKQVPIRAKRSNVVSLEAVRMRAGSNGPKEVQSGTTAIRLHYITQYIEWLVQRQLLKLTPTDSVFSPLKDVGDLIVNALRERAPRLAGRNAVDLPEGLSAEVVQRLLEVSDVASVDNPWLSPHVKARNSVIVSWFLKTGLRRGELANIKVSDIDFQRHEVLIARRADDRSDPRRRQPLVKTNSRLIPLSTTLVNQTHDYIVRLRRNIKGARKHSYLFVAEGTGAPLSLAAINLVFADLRQCSDIPKTVRPHALRHTWNDSFSTMADEQGWSDEVEKQMRSRAMGWSDNSKMAATYTRRHTRVKGRKVILELQEKLEHPHDREKK